MQIVTQLLFIQRIIGFAHYDLVPIPKKISSYILTE